MTLLISRILLTGVISYVLYIVWTKDVNLVKWIPTQIKGMLPINEEVTLFTEKDKNISQHYFYALSEFIVKFRINLHTLIPATKNEPEIQEAFQYGTDLLKTAPNLTKVNEDLIKKIFTNFDFTKPAINFTPQAGHPHPTNMSMLIGELTVLNQKCDDILTKYASTGNYILIHDIEIIKNKTGNLIGSFGLQNKNVNYASHVNDIGKLFVHITKSFELVSDIKGGTYNKTQEPI